MVPPAALAAARGAVTRRSVLPPFVRTCQGLASSSSSSSSSSTVCRPHGAVLANAAARRGFSTPVEAVVKATSEDDGSLEMAEAGAGLTGGTGGHSGQTGVLWFSNVYPTRSFRFDFRQALTHTNHERLIPELMPEGVEVLHMVPREREGGAFVYFRAPPSFVFTVLKNLSEADAGGKPVPAKRFLPKGKEDILSKVCAGISQHLKEHPVRAYLCPFPVRAFRVRGEPYIEDLHSRYPGSTLRVKADSGTLHEETLFAQLRRYGQLDDLTRLPDGNGFRASFRYTSAAVSARNCLHRSRVDPAAEIAEGSSTPRLHIEFEPFMQKYLRDMVANNPRYVIPVIILTTLGMTYFIWDPIRINSVQFKLAQAQDASGGTAQDGGRTWREALFRTWARWSAASARYLPGSRRRESDLTDLLADLWRGRDAEMGSLRAWLTQPQDRVMLLTGPRGNGQKEIVRHIVRGAAVTVDVGTMLDQASDEQVFVNRFCRAFGYWPAPLAERQLTAVLDLVMPGSGKLGQGSEVLNIVQRILSLVTQALTAWRLTQLQGSASPDAYRPPLFVIEGFTSENKDRYPGFFELLVTWASYVSGAQLARVLFIADNSFAEPMILAALKDQPEKLDVQQLRDADRAAVQATLQRRLGVEMSDDELRAVGGRFRDIQALFANVQGGAEPHMAVRRLVEAAAMTVRTLLVTGQPGAKWSRPQLWKAIRLLASMEPGGAVPYDVFLWGVFRGDEGALRSMLQSNLIAVVHAAEAMEGDLTRRVVVPGSPLYAEVFRRLVLNEGVAAVFDLEVAKEDIKREQKTLEAYEADLVRLQEVDDVRRMKGRNLQDPNEALRKRKTQLLDLLLEQQKKLEGYHKARRDAMAILKQRNAEFHTQGEALQTAAPAPPEVPQLEDAPPSSKEIRDSVVSVGEAGCQTAVTAMSHARWGLWRVRAKLQDLWMAVLS